MCAIRNFGSAWCRLVDRFTGGKLACKYDHSLGQLEKLAGLTDDVLVDGSTGRQVDRLTGRQIKMFTW